MDNHTLKKELINSKKYVILWGGTLYGEIAYQVITQRWGGKVSFIIDNKISKVEWADIEIKRSDVLEYIRDALIIICADNSFGTIKDIIEPLESKNIHYYDLQDILEEYKTWLISENGKLKNSYLYGDIDIDEVILRYNYYAGVKNNYPDKLYFPYCVLCITTKCSLRCDNCAAFVTKYPQNVNYSFAYLRDNFSKILDAVDGIQELELMGGEPFLHPELTEILKWCISEKKIHGIKIVTNGTIFPAKELWDILSNYKIKVVVDDYGSLSNKLTKIVNAAKENNVNYEIQHLQTWYQLEPIVYKDFTKEELISIYANCNFKTCLGITNGSFYHCNVAGHMNNACLIPDNEVEKIQLEGVDMDVDKLKGILKEYLNIEYMKACAWCNYSSKCEIPVAKQLCNHKMKV